MRTRGLDFYGSGKALADTVMKIAVRKRCEIP
jgi:hypothetical protein